MLDTTDKNPAFHAEDGENPWYHFASFSAKAENLKPL